MPRRIMAIAVVLLVACGMAAPAASAAGVAAPTKKAKVAQQRAESRKALGLLAAAQNRAEDFPTIVPSDKPGRKPAAKPAAAPAEKPVADPSAPVQAAPASVSSAAREQAAARGSRAAKDLFGVQPSLYTGKWYRPRAEDTRRCIVKRESNGRYTSNGGAYFGAYQMSRALARGATWMMQREVRKEMGDEGVRIVSALRKTTPNHWNRYWQDRAFWTVWRNGTGAGHWAGGARNC